jgi:transcriptional regulator with XRE-family HTH domain
MVDSLVAERIRAYRKELGLSQSDLAEKLGITYQQVQKYEKGSNRIGSGRLFEIAGLFNIPIQALFPESNATVKHAENSTAEMKAISDFILSADGWRLCRAFLQIKDHQRRKKIIALVQEITES